MDQEIAMPQLNQRPSTLKNRADAPRPENFYNDVLSLMSDKLR